MIVFFFFFFLSGDFVFVYSEKDTFLSIMWLFVFVFFRDFLETGEAMEREMRERDKRERQRKRESEREMRE